MKYHCVSSSALTQIVDKHTVKVVNAAQYNQHPRVRLTWFLFTRPGFNIDIIEFKRDRL